LIVGWEGHPDCKKTGCWFVGGEDLTGALHDLQLQLSPPLPSSERERERERLRRSQLTNVAIASDVDVGNCVIVLRNRWLDCTEKTAMIMTCCWKRHFIPPTRGRWRSILKLSRRTTVSCRHGNKERRSCITDRQTDRECDVM